MTRALTAVGAALALIIGGLVLAIQLTRDDTGIAVDNQLSENLTRAIAQAESQGDGRVDLRALAPFPWDEVLIVERGTPDDAISELLGYEWTGDLKIRAGELLIFLEEGRVARFADYRGDGRFTLSGRLPRERAVLRVRDLVVSRA